MIQLLRVYTLIISILLFSMLVYCGLVIMAFKKGVYGNGDISNAILIFVISALVLFVGILGFKMMRLRKMIFPIIVMLVYTIGFILMYVFVIKPF